MKSCRGDENAVSKSLKQRLNDLCRDRGLAWIQRPDEPISSPPYEKWWGCAYDPESGAVHALVTGSSHRAERKRLLSHLEEGGEAPAVERSRKGHVVKRGSQRTVLVMFDDGEVLVVPAPYAAPVGAEVGMAVRLVEF